LKKGDKLSALHTKLKQEADKIRKWRNLKESEIREKVWTNTNMQVVFVLFAGQEAARGPVYY